jgi:putative restriction endonuclease
MNFYIVFQNASHKKAKNEGFIWAHKLNNKGKTVHHWLSVSKVKKGDIIFNNINGVLNSIITATEDCIEKENPKEYDKEQTWEKDGYFVKADYVDVKKPIKYKEYKDEILYLQSKKYAPFNTNGDGNQGYLFSISQEFANFLFKKVGHQSPEEDKIIIEVENELPSGLNSTDKEQIVKTRIGQGIFKAKLLKFGCKCRICEVNNLEFLRASHTKPWKVSNNQERLDANNGFLFCPAHDILYDKGFISFKDDGNILVSDELDYQSKQLLNVNDFMKIELLEGHKVYLDYHRKNVFRRNS